MSSAQNVQTVRERIIELARSIEKLSKSDVPPETFFHEFLKRVVAAIGARAGAVWLLNDRRQLQLYCEHNLRDTGFYQNPNAQSVNQRILIDVMGHGQACTLSPDDQDVELPTNDLLILAALVRDKQCVGVVEIFQRAETPPQARPGFLQFVEHVTGYACRYLERQKETTPAAQQKHLSEEFEEFLLQLHASLDAKEVAAVAANDGRLLIGCDRLSVAVQYGKKTVIRAISGQDSVNQRANLVRKMTALASKVIQMREPLIYTGRVEHLPPQIEEPLADYIQESGSRMVIVWPLFETEPLVEEEEDETTGRRKEKERKPIGGLVVEQISHSEPRPGVLENIELISNHVAEALTNARTYERLFLLPVWRFLGRCFRWLEGRNWLKVLGALLLVVAAILGLVFVPRDYRVTCEGRLMPVVQHDVFAPWDGEVVEIYVQSGQRVAKGEPLLRLRNDELESELVATKNELIEKQELLFALRAQLDEAIKTADRENQIRLQGQIAETQIQIDAIQEQLEILQKRHDRLTVRAPIAGVVPTFQIEQLLLHRPVQRGEKLLEVMDDTGPWRLELEVEEHRVGHILRAQRERNDPHLEVEFALATNIESTYHGKLDRLATRTNASEKKGSIVLAYVSLDADQLPVRRIGAEVRAKINCGKRSLGYVLFGDVIEFCQKYFWL